MTSWRLCYWVANTRASVCVRAPTHVRQRVCVCERFCHSCRCVCLCWLLINMQHTHADRSLTSSKCRCLAPAISLADGPLNAGSGWRRWGRWVICVRWVGAINTSARYFLEHSLTAAAASIKRLIPNRRGCIAHDFCQLSTVEIR